MWQDYLLEFEQCPPEDCWPDPIAIAGGSSNRLIGLKKLQSQSRKSAREIQKINFNRLIIFIKNHTAF